MSAAGLVVPDVGHELVVVDVEGNGQRPPDIVEIATLRLDGGREVTPADVRSWLVRPARPITAVVTRKVHGITGDDVSNAPPWRDVAAQVQRALGSRVLVAHSATVERDVVSAHLPDWRPRFVLDTLRLARGLLSGVPGGYGLDNLITQLRLPPPPERSGPGEVWRRHRAPYDVWMTASLLCRLLDEAGPDLSAVWEAATLPGPWSAGVGPDRASGDLNPGPGPGGVPEQGGLW